MILLPSHLAVELCSLLFPGRIIDINLNVADVEIISGVNKWSGNKHKKKAIKMYKSVCYSSMSVHPAPSIR